MSSATPRPAIEVTAPSQKTDPIAVEIASWMPGAGRSTAAAAWSAAILPR